MKIPYAKSYPEVILSAVTGPGVALPKLGLPTYLYVVYSISPQMHLGFKDCIPSIKVIEDGITKHPEKIPESLRKSIKKIVVLRDDDFLTQCWMGSLWPIMAMESQTKEIFCQSGEFICNNRERFLNRETITKWSKTPIHKLPQQYNLTVMHWIYAHQQLIHNSITHTLDKTWQEYSERLLTDRKFAKSDSKTRKKALKENSDKLPEPLSRAELNDILISSRMMG